MNLHQKNFEGKLIGEGYFYKVYIIKDKIKQDFFVVKIAKFSYTSKDHLNYLDEIYHHCQIEHPCVSQYFGYSLRDFEGKNHLSFVMKYYQNSSLQTFLYCNKSVKGNWNTSIQIEISGITNGMKYLHSVGITHGSLRPSQIMLDENEDPHISDIDFTQIVKTHFSQEYFQSKIDVSLKSTKDFFI